MELNTFDRRGFMKATGLTAAALSMPYISRAQDATQKLRVGIVGCGGRGRFVGKVAVEDGRYEIASVADYFQDQADARAADFNVPANRRFTGLNCCQKMIDAGGIDIVVVTSPPYFHPEQVEAAVEAGLHVWLAKPIAVDAQGVARIGAAAKKATAKQKCFLVDFQTRALGQFPEAARRVAAGDIGKLGYGEIEGTCGAFGLKVPHGGQETKLRNWLQWRDLCGESIIEYSIHSVDMASLMIGRNPVSARGTCARNFLDNLPTPIPGDVRDIWTTEYDFGDGLTVLFRAKRFATQGLVSGIGINVKLFGTVGALSADYSGEVFIKGKNSFSGDRFMQKKIRGIYKLGIVENWKTMYDNISKANYAQETVQPSLDCHYLALLAREACYRQGEVVTFDEVVNSKKALQFDTTGLKS